MDRKPSRTGRWIASFEGEAGWSWIILLLGWILARNLLEGVLERPHQLGFDWREEISAPMVFLHFPLFYLALFTGICLWLRLLSGRPILRVAQVVSLGYGLLLVAPILDAILSGGHGYDLKYLLGFGPFLWRFWNPTAVLAEVSPGQRAEIALACLLGGAYVFAIRRSRDGAEPGSRRNLPPIVLAPAAALGIFLMAAFLGAWPSLFAQIPLREAPSGGPLEAYSRVYRGGGLIPSESRRLAAVMALPFLAALPWFLRGIGRERFRALTRHLGWTRVMYYTGLVPAGAYIGYLLYGRGRQVWFSNPVDYAAVAVLWAGMVAAYVASLLWNDFFDREADRINAPGRPLVDGTLDAASAVRLGIASAALALFLALCISYQAFLLMAACLLLSLAYSAPPLRLKKWPFLSTLCLALLSCVSALTGFSLFGQEMTPRVFPPDIAAALLVGVTLGFTAKDLKDAPGDRETGVRTLATLLPPARARWAVAILVALGYLAAPLFLRLGPWFVALSVAFAVMSALAVLRVRRPEEPLLGGFILFAVALLAFLTANPRPLWSMNRLTVDSHAAVLKIEREARESRRREPADPERAHSIQSERTLIGQLMPILPAGIERERLLRAEADADSNMAPRALEEALRIRPLESRYWEALARHWSDRGDYEEAAAVCTKALGLGLRPGDFLRNRAAARIAAGEAPAAVEGDLDASFRFGQRRDLVRVLTGDLLQRNGRAPEAEAAYHAAIEESPDLPEAWAGLGETLYASGHLTEAVDAFRRAQGLSPHDPWILNNLGVALRDGGDPVAAETVLEQAHRLAPGLFEPLYNLGLLCARLGRDEEARSYLAEAGRIRPGFPPLQDAIERLGR